MVDNYLFYIIYIISMKKVSKISASGVIPIIFSEAIMLYFSSFIPYLRNVYGIWYNCIFIILIIVITFFYRSIALPIRRMVYDLKRKETLLWVILLSIIATFPTFILNRSLSLFYGGSSLLIIVGVILETLKHFHTYLNAYDYLICK